MTLKQITVQHCWAELSTLSKQTTSNTEKTLHDIEYIGLYRIIVEKQTEYLLLFLGYVNM